MIILMANIEFSEYGEYYTHSNKEIIGVFDSTSLVESAIKEYLSNNKLKWNSYHDAYYRKTGEYKKDYMLVCFFVANIEINKPIGSNFEAFKRYERG